MTDKKAITQALAYAPAFLNTQQRLSNFVGVQAAARLDGELLLNHAAGMADIEAGTPLTTDHLFRVASHSKTFTGTAIMQLLEAGKLRLDDAIATHVPELADCEMQDATIRELMSHGSGMLRDGVDCNFWQLLRPFPDKAELIEVIRTAGKVLERNTRFKYTNLGYSVLGLIIEAATGQSYRDYIQRNIIDRLGLKNTGPDLNLERIEEYAKGYTSAVFGPRRSEIVHMDTHAESSATGVYSTASDLCSYFEAHLDGDNRLLSETSKRIMRQRQWDVSAERHYGVGMSGYTINGRAYYGHNGGYPGHLTASRYDPQRNLVLSVLTNSLDGPPESLLGCIVSLIDLALDHKHAALTTPQPDARIAPFLGRFANLWGISDVINLGGRVYIVDIESPNPAAAAVEMEIISDTELRNLGTQGTGAYGEIMRYNFDDAGRVVSIKGSSGSRMVPADQYELPSKVVCPPR